MDSWSQPAAVIGPFDVLTLSLAFFLAVAGTIVVAVAASELIGPVLTRDVLRRAGEIPARARRRD